MDISISRIKCYKRCLRQYEFRYVHELESEIPNPNLVTGSNYHSKIEKLIQKGEYNGFENKTDVMAQAFKKFIYPNYKFKTAEQDFKIPLTENINLIGRIDAYLDTGIPVEHKTSRSKPDEWYKYKLAWDDQIAAYMIASNQNKMLYTVCQKPTIRQRKGETEKEYLERCFNWYDPSKISAFTITWEPEKLKQKKQEFIQIAKEMEKRKVFYPNQNNCYFQGSCPFEEICLDYEPGIEEVPLGFKKREKR